jgi:peptide/nickel transport system permease protein
VGGNRTSLIARRIVRAVFVLWGTSTVVFFIIRLSGDPVALLLPPEAGADEIERVRHIYGFDQPLTTQYGIFLQQLLHLDFGRSIRFGQPAMDVVLERVGPTVELALLAIVVALALAFPIGIVGALRANTKLGELLMGVALLGQSTPIFFFGIVLILVFSAQLHWLPTGGRGDVRQLIMPVFTLSMFTMASVARLTRSSMLDVMGQDYIRTARAKGASELRIIVRHALKNSALPIITVIGLQFGALLGGAVVTETIFSWPGMGRLVIQAIDTRDYPIVQAAVFLAAIWFIVVNTIVDLTYVYLDPRVKYV